MVKAGIPLVCGLSGSANIATWSLLLSKNDLSPDQVRHFLIGTWSVLCMDGGHSLQEVLSTVHLAVEHTSRKLEPHPSISLNTLNSLKKVTEEMDPLGDGKTGKLFGAYHSTLFSKIQDRNFQNALVRARDKLQQYYFRVCSESP